MTPNERRAIRARQVDIRAAWNVLKRRRGFSAAEYQAITRGKELMNGLTSQEKVSGSPERLGAVLRLLDIRAEAYLNLVDDLKSQDAFMTVLTAFADNAWEEHAGYPLYLVRPMPDDPNYTSIKHCIERWVAEGYKRVAERENPVERVPLVERALETLDVAPTVFISYSWDSKEHQQWVRDLAGRLKEKGITVMIDSSDLKLGASAPQFMEVSVRDCTRVLVICTEVYKAKFDTRAGGAGYEGNIITGEIINQLGENKFIPVLRRGDWRTAVPTALFGVYGVDLREDSADEFERLVNGLLEK